MICERRDLKLGVNKVNYFEICLDSEGFGPEMGLCPDMVGYGTVWTGTVLKDYRTQRTTGEQFVDWLDWEIYFEQS